MGVVVGTAVLGLAWLGRIYFPNLLPSPQWHPHSTLLYWLGKFLLGIVLLVTTAVAILFPILGFVWLSVPDRVFRRALLIDWIWMAAYFSALLLSIWHGPLCADCWQWRPVP